ncbi:hypothetical protein MYX04_07510 [Nitrospiraceae bacterium AH_259_D15_M11_P09]|nr:hypothetical protein [Nitrospiraceae bacterium AH_259_D15_M11_P09]
MFPWSLLLRAVLPAIPEIVSTVKTLRQGEQRVEVLRGDADARLQQLEKSMDTQLQLIEKLATQLVGIQKILRRAYLVALTALVLSLIALGVLIFS